MRRVLILCMSFVLLSLMFGPGGQRVMASQEGVDLGEGVYIGMSPEERAEIRKANHPEDKGPAIASAESLPVIEDELVAQAAETALIENVRVIIYLDYQPQELITDQVRAKYASEKAAIRGEVKAIMATYADKRSPGATSDAENYTAEVLIMSAEDKASMRALNEQNEALSLAIKKEVGAALSAEVDEYQQSVKNAVEDLGGLVEFGTITGNAVIALVPAGSVGELADIEKVAHVAADHVRESHLNVADNATKISDTGGLWASGQDGGLYDPAVLDSGTDLEHPALKDSASRENHWSWYLVAAAGAANYNDASDEDDRQGHGTHVMGIVASYNATYKGMGYGVEKAVTLKAGYRATDGRAYMYDSDAMNLVDRALYHHDELRPTYGTDVFNDDVDGINLSYGGSTTSDDTAYSRFWDSVVHSYADTVVTISAGNSGPSNTVFNSPAVSYNAITVASVYDQGTTSRADDVISSFSSRGPTDLGRRKPDIAAPGSSISSCNNNWEGLTSDFISKSGTSMSAPMVQGVAMALMDAGVFDEKEIKALLINTAQKNDTALNFESDSDGWSTAYGWGYMNTWAAYYHRNDTFLNSVTENGTAGDYKLYSGVMRDEGTSNGDQGASYGEGRDRATLVWNRHATYLADNYPTTYSSLSDLDLRLYRESNNSTIDSDTTTRDNVHQVRIGSGAANTDVVIKVYSFSSNFDHGGTTEPYALATEEGFSAVDLPSSFGAVGIWPTEMEPGEVRTFEWWLTNSSDIASHNHSFTMVPPAGWTLVSGANPQSKGSIAVGGSSSHGVWSLRAQNTLQDGVNVVVRSTHNSYGEPWGPGAWGMGVNVRWDTTAPTPNPMTWATIPYELNTSQIRAVATTANDLHKPIYYHFFVYDHTTGSSVYLNDWEQTSTTMTLSGLNANSNYRFFVRARDNATTPNYTSWSVDSYEYTDIETPTGITHGALSPTSLTEKSTNTPTGLTRGSSGLWLECQTAAGAAVGNSGWKQNNNYWTQGSLAVNQRYRFRARARNGDGSITPYSGYYYRYTAANIPSAPTVGNGTDTTLDVEINPNGNPSHTTYAIYAYSAGSGYYYLNASGGNNGATPVWRTEAAWGTVTATGLTPDTTYSFWTRARNGDGVITGFSSGTAAATEDRTITVLVPNGGETWKVGNDCNIAWTSQYAGSSVRIYLSRNGGVSWSIIALSTPNDGSYTWEVVGPQSTQCRIRITSLFDASATDTSDANFTILVPTPYSPMPTHQAKGVSVFTNLSWNNYLYMENFNDGVAQNWLEDVGSYWSVVGSEYRAQNPVPGAQDSMVATYAGQTFDNFSYQARMRRVQASGLARYIVFRATPDFDYDPVRTGSGYMFGIDENSYFIAKIVAGTETVLAGWIGSPAINTDPTQWNTLKVVACGAEMKFFINGSLVNTFNDTSVASGRIGLLGFTSSSSPCTHFFDDVIVGEPTVGIASVNAEQEWYNQQSSAKAGTAADAPGDLDIQEYQGVAPAANTGPSSGEAVAATPKVITGSSTDAPVKGQAVAAKEAQASSYAAAGSLSKVAIFQDSSPWGSTKNQDILTANGVSWTIYGSADMGSVDLSSYDKVIISSVQDDAFYDALEANRVWFEAYVTGGGVLDMHLAMQFSSNLPGKLMPGGFEVAYLTHDDVTIVDGPHPIINTPHVIAPADLDGWSLSTHGYISAIPAGAKTILTHTGNGEPCAMDLALGAGRILTTVQTVEWSGADYNYLENMICYGIVAQPTVAIFQDNAPWGSTWNQDVLRANGISYRIYGSSAMGMIDLMPFQKVVVASQQDEDFYIRLEANAGWFEDYVEAGGLLDMHLATFFTTPVAGKVFAGGFVSSAQSCHDDVTIVDGTHPLVTKPNLISDGDLDGWGCSSHGSFTAAPVGAATIIKNADDDEPCAMDALLGSGRIVATLQTVEWSGASMPYLENMLLYGLLKQTTYDVYFSTANPPVTRIYKDLKMTRCDPKIITSSGRLDSCAVYYWRVVAKSGGTTRVGPVWAFRTELVGDFNNDGVVDLDDVGYFGKHWLENNCPSSNWCGGADLDREKGMVDRDDLLILMDHWMDTCP